MTPDLLRAVTGCTPERAALFAPHLLECMAVYGVNTPQREAAFLAQLGHESQSLLYVREIASGEAYEGRMDLGNTRPGDGVRYRGRGLIQVTGRDNYARARNRMRRMFGNDVPDFEAQPEALELPRWAALSAGDFWDREKLNALADSGEFIKIGRAINRGNPNASKPANGEADRIKRWEKAKAVLGLAADRPAPALPQALKEPAMPPLLAMLGKTLISAFAPLAAEKISRELSRHIDNPEVVEQMTAAAVETAKAVTGISDPLDAVSAARQSPEVMQQVQEQTLAKLAELAPLLDKLSDLEGKAWAASEDSADRAAARYAGRNPDEWDMTPTLVGSAIAMFFALLVLVGGIAIYQAGWKDGVAAEVWAQVAGLIGFVTGVLVTVFSFRFGTTRQSGAKDVLIGELSKGVNR